MPRKKKDPNAPKVPRKVREAKPVAAPPPPAADPPVIDPAAQGPEASALPPVEQNATGTLNELKPAPPAASAPFGIGARRG